MSDPSVILDSSAVLALVQREPGWQRVLVAMQSGEVGIGAVNWSEVYAKLTDQNFPDTEVRETMLLPIRIEPFTAEDAIRAGALRRGTRPFGLSFGDRACLALADRLAAAVLTADKAWSRLDVGIAIQQIR